MASHTAKMRLVVLAALYAESREVYLMMHAFAAWKTFDIQAHEANDLYVARTNSRVCLMQQLKRGRSCVPGGFKRRCKRSSKKETYITSTAQTRQHGKESDEVQWVQGARLPK